MEHENLNTPQNPPLQQTAVSGMLPDAIEFAIWLRDNFSTMSAQRGGKWLHKRYWRRDFTDEVVDVDTLYKEWLSNYR